MEPSDALQDFRRSFYECLHRRSDALFELADAILGADASAPSPVHLSLQPAHRRGWGSFYAALARGRIDAEVLRDLLVCHPLAGSSAPPVYAVDTSPERGYYYHPSRHSAGQPIVAGWAYQFVAQLNFVRESWTAPVDVERLLPAQDANEVAAEQVKALCWTGSGKEGPFPCSSSMRATTPSRCSRDWRGARARSSSACAPGAALLRRPESVRPAGTHRTPPSPRAQDEVR